MTQSLPTLRLAFTATTLLLAACSKQPTPESKPAAPAAPVPAATPTVAPAPAPAEAATYSTLDQKVSYGIGHDIGSRLTHQQGVKIDLEALKSGMTDGLTGAPIKVSEADLQAAFQELQKKAMAAASAAAEQSKSAAKDYLEKNKARAGVVTTASGLQYEIITAGTGAKPQPTDTVEVHYHGTLMDGKVFDSSRDRGQTIQFPVTGVIQGWIEALQLMPVGSKWKLFIHPDLGYGPRPSGNIPPNSVLIFEVELISLKTPPAQPATATPPPASQ